ncbi:hypothetical protein [Proteus mirabilis]|uniref:hypothetical protein n=1 Tax=Proteus mirabilis TaxID=584 RepID=UPI0034D58FC6
MLKQLNALPCHGLSDVCVVDVNNNRYKFTFSKINSNNNIRHILNHLVKLDEPFTINLDKVCIIEIFGYSNYNEYDMTCLLSDNGGGMVGIFKLNKEVRPLAFQYIRLLITETS